MKIATQKKLTIGLLAAIIVFSYGYSYDKYMNPPRAIASAAEQVIVVELMESLCPRLIPLYEANLEPDGTMLIDTGLELLERCQDSAMRGHKEQTFHEMFVEEMGKANDW